MNKENLTLDYWISNFFDKTKTRFEKITKTQKRNNFDDLFSFTYGGLNLKKDVGPKNFNQHTFAHLVNSLTFFLKQEKINDIILFVNNQQDIPYFNFLYSEFKDKSININTLSKTFTLIGEASFVCKKQQKYGLYINFLDNAVNFKILNPDGKEFNFLNYSKLNLIISSIPFSFDSERAINIDSTLPTLIEFNTIDYFNLNYKQFINFELTEKVIIISPSDYLTLFLESLQIKNLIVVRSSLRNHLNFNDPRNYHEAYRVAKKEKINIILNVDAIGSKMALAFKTNKIFKFLTSFETSLFLQSFDPRRINIANSFYSPNSFLTKINSISATINLKINSEFEYYFSNTAFNDSINNLLILLKNKELKQIDFSKLFLNIREQYGFWFNEESEQKISEEKVFDYFTKLKKYNHTSEIKFTKIKLEKENEHLTRYRAYTENGGEIIFNYEHASSILKTNFFVMGEDQVKSFDFKNELVKTTNQFIKNEPEKNAFTDKKSLLKTILFSGIFITALALVFTYVLDWNDIVTSLETMFASTNDVEFYLLFSNFIITPLFFALTIFVIIKNYNKNAKFLDFFKGSLMYLFIYSVTSISLLALGTLVWYLGTKKYKKSEIITASSIQLVYSLIVNSIAGVGLFAFGHSYLVSTGLESLYLYWLGVLGFILGSFTTFFVFILGFSSTFQRAILIISEKIFFQFGIENKYINFSNNFNNTIISMKHNSRIAFKKMNLLFLSMLILVVWKIYTFSFYFAPYNLLMKNAGDVNNLPLLSSGMQYFGLTFWGISSLQFIVQQATSLLFFIPSGLGFYEIFLTQGIIEILTSNNVSLEMATSIANQGVFLSRFFSLYGMAIFTAIPFIIKSIKYTYQKNRLSHDRWAQA